MTYAFFVLLRATPAWLRLSRDERRRQAEQHLSGALSASPGVRIRHFDAEAFSGICSDVLLVEATDPQQHYFFIERLRDTPLINQPYFEVVHIIPAIEDGYRAFEEKEGLDGREGREGLDGASSPARR